MPAAPPVRGAAGRMPTALPSLALGINNPTRHDKRFRKEAKRGGTSVVEVVEVEAREGIDEVEVTKGGGAGWGVMGPALREGELEEKLLEFKNCMFSPGGKYERRVALSSGVSVTTLTLTRGEGETTSNEILPEYRLAGAPGYWAFCGNLW